MFSSEFEDPKVRLRQTRVITSIVTCAGFLVDAEDFGVSQSSCPYELAEGDEVYQTGDNVGRLNVSYRGGKQFGSVCC